MATNPALCNHAEEDYIDMGISTSSNLFCSSPQVREFEFQMCNSIYLEKDTTTSPADELFYKGKLLPLHLPPRLQMVQKLLQNPTIKTFQEDENCSSIVPSTNNSTPFDQSCNVSPSESRRVSSELNPEDHFFEWSTELSAFINGDQPKKSWSKKLKLIKQSSFGQKLKASRAYLKSLFTNSGCSDESCAKAGRNEKEAGLGSKGNKEYLSKYIKVAKKGPSGQIGKGITLPTLATVVMSRTDKEGFDHNSVGGSQRKSFSGAIKQRPTMKCSSSSSNSSCASSSSSSFSFNSNGFYELQLLKRSSSASSEIDGSIEAAIAHCKNSQQLLTSTNAVNETGFCSFSASRIAASNKDQKRPGVCL